MILVINAGSSSIKFELFNEALTSVLDGAVTDIGDTAAMKFDGLKSAIAAPDHKAALDCILQALVDCGITLASLRAAAHRVVHGGTRFSTPERLTDQVIAEIEACVPLAPLHNPHNLSGIHALAALAPELDQFCSFDTAFHTTMPEVAARYALPQHWNDQGLRRYGFHGSSYASMVHQFGNALPQRLLALHLGNGASLCAIKNGQSVATTMGFSPLSGITMGTRTGDIDGMAVLQLANELGVEQAGCLLNNECGLKGLGGTNDMVALLKSDSDDAKFAIDHFTYWAVRHSGSMIAAMGGLDAIAFTGGIGENSQVIRDHISAGLTWAGNVPVHVVEADEERQIARDAMSVMNRA